MDYDSLNMSRDSRNPRLTDLGSSPDRTNASADPVKGREALSRIERSLGPDAWKLTPATMAVKLSQGHWQPVRHLLFIAMVIAKAIREGEKRIIITLPPRHGKSELLSVYTPIWAFDRNPKCRIMLTSYGSELATDFSYRVREMLQNPPYPLRADVPKDTGQVGRFRTTQGGAMYALGIGGSILGRGADLLLVDDFIKNAKEASSQSVRQAHYDWFVSTALTRVEPGGTVIILAQRWDMDDLIGRLLIDDPYNEWTEIRLPAVAEENDPLNRVPGEVLWPERRDIEYMHRMKATLGNFYWQALFQQKPISRAADIVDLSMLAYLDILPTHPKLRHVRAWDLASTADGGDYTVGSKLTHNLLTDKTIIADICRGQWRGEMVEQKMRMIASQDGKETLIVLEQEPGSSGKMYAEYLKRDVLRGYKVKIVPSSGNKFTRAQPLLAGISRGDVQVKKAKWNKTMIDEFESFPEGTNDDIVDSMSNAWVAMHQQGKGSSLVWTPSQRVHINDGKIILDRVGM